MLIADAVDIIPKLVGSLHYWEIMKEKDYPGKVWRDGAKEQRSAAIQLWEDAARLIQRAVWVSTTYWTASCWPTFSEDPLLLEFNDLRMSAVFG